MLLPFIKVVPPASWNRPDWGPQVQSVKVAQRGLRGNDLGTLVKRAGHLFADEIRRLEKKAGEELIHLIALGAFEDVGCFFAGTPVQTDKGLRPIEEIAAGELVLTHRNRFRTVRQVFSGSYTGPRTTLCVRCLPEPLVSTGDHPYWVVRGKDFGVTRRCECWIKLKGLTKLEATDRAVARSAAFVPAQDLRPGDFMIVPIAPTGDDEVLPDDMAYIAGVYLAEGCPARRYGRPRQTGPCKTVMVLSSTNDTAVLAQLQETAASWGHRLDVQPAPHTDQALRATLNHKKFAKECVRLFGRNATDKFLHPVIFQQSREWRLRFLAGYLDGDGCLTQARKQERYVGGVRANTASLNLALDMQRLLAGLGVPSSVTRGCNKASNGCMGKGDFVIYEIAVGSAYASEIIPYCLRLPANFKIPPRQRQAHAQIGTAYMLVPVNSVVTDQVESETKYNFEVSEDNSYTTLVTSHNCNANGDGFDRQVCRDHHHTFVTKPLTKEGAYFYRRHQNKDPRKSYGIVKLSAYNEAMKRVELVVALNATKEAAERNGGLVADDEMEKLHEIDGIPVSMACSVSYDQCSGCGNRARNRTEYCDHSTCKYGGLKDCMGKIAADGHQLHARNPYPRFFDISNVGKGADKTAFVLGPVKVASALVKIASGQAPSGAELAESYGCPFPEEVLVHGLEKTAALQARLLYRLEQAHRELPAAEADRAFDRRLPSPFDKEASLPPEGALPERLKALASAHVLLPPAEFFTLVVGGTHGRLMAEKMAELARPALPAACRQLLVQSDAEDCLSENPYRPARSPLAAATAAWARTKEAAYSVTAPAVRERVFRSALAFESAPAAPREYRPGEPGPGEKLARHYTLYQLGFLAHEGNEHYVPEAVRTARFG